MLGAFDTWFETMRTPSGYGGAVVHWWQNCFAFTGAGLDWRYEGIIIGYLNLYRKTGAGHWLSKARIAGDDLVNGQLASGNYRNSSFEMNPYHGGTPHEFAASLALLHLAQVLKAQDNPDWLRYFTAAETNLKAYAIAHLWDAERQYFRDNPAVVSFVPNKSATLCEALLMLATLSGDAVYADVYALPTLRAIIAHQAESGAIDQYSLDGQCVGRYFPYYIARCVPALLDGYKWTEDTRYLESAYHAMGYVIDRMNSDGSFPQVIYANGTRNMYPQWIAANGDILRAASLFPAFGVGFALGAAEVWFKQGLTAHGFASQISQSTPPALPDFRDVFPVCGWHDKAFRYLTEQLPNNAASPLPEAFVDVETECLVRGKRALYRETADSITLHQGKHTLYRWHKGETWAAVCAPELLWR